jgi:hypothetical protein
MKRPEWMSDDQWYCAEMVAELVGGFHHVYGKFHPYGKGIKTSVFTGWLSTFDFDRLTRLVFLAHDRCVRVDVVSSGPRLVGLTLHRRHSREGRMYERHPTIEGALAQYRAQVPRHG